MGSSLNGGRIERHIAEAARGNRNAWFELGICYSSGSGVAVDLVEAHKWFNLAAMHGSGRAQECRSEIAGDMSAQQIASAQKAARAWLRTTAV